jgi:hypothetical protein
MMAITRSDELRHSPAARDTKSSFRLVANGAYSGYLLEVLCNFFFNFKVSEN